MLLRSPERFGFSSERRGLPVDERIIHLVSLITNQVQSKQDLFSNEGKIMDSLMSSGYRLQEADTALALMQSLSQGQDENIDNDERAKPVSAMRAMSTQERQRFTV